MIKVLVVEDDPMVGKLHEHYLTQIKGFQLCDIVRNSDEALKIMQTKEYNLVILDIFMPGMDGLQLLAKIREQEYDVDVIIVSAANDKDKIKAALRLGKWISADDISWKWLLTEYGPDTDRDAVRGWLWTQKGRRYGSNTHRL